MKLPPLNQVRLISEPGLSHYTGASPGHELSEDPRKTSASQVMGSGACCCRSVAQSCQTLCDLVDCSTPGFPVLHHLPEFAQTHVHRVGDAIQPAHPLRPLVLLPSIFPSIRVFSSQSALCIRWSKYWSFSFSISPSNDYSGLISFSIDWFDFLTIQGTLKSLLQHHSSKTSILQRSAFFLVQLSHLYMTTGKTIAMTIWTLAAN